MCREKNVYLLKRKDTGDENLQTKIRKPTPREGDMEQTKGQSEEAQCPTISHHPIISQK